MWKCCFDFRIRWKS